MGNPTLGEVGVFLWNEDSIVATTTGAVSTVVPLGTGCWLMGMLVVAVVAKMIAVMGLSETVDCVGAVRKEFSVAS